MFWAPICPNTNKQTRVTLKKGNKLKKCSNSHVSKMIYFIAQRESSTPQIRVRFVLEHTKITNSASTSDM